MSGVAVVRHLLVNHAPLVAVVAAAKIVGGPSPAKTALPAISLTSVSSVPRQTVAMSEVKRLVTERVQVTVQSKTYRQKKEILELVRAALTGPGKGTINGVQSDSILLDTLGPDLDDVEESLYSQSRDCIVKWFE